MRAGAFALVLLLAAAPAIAVPEMNVSQFLYRAERAKLLGPLAKASPDYAALRGEVERVARKYQFDVKAARAAGRKPPSCLPSNPQLTPDDLLNHMRRMPAPLRERTSVRTAIYEMLKQRYPCR